VRSNCEMGMFDSWEKVLPGPPSQSIERNLIEMDGDQMALAVTLSVPYPLASVSLVSTQYQPNPHLPRLEKDPTSLRNPSLGVADLSTKESTLGIQRGPPYFSALTAPKK